MGFTKTPDRVNPDAQILMFISAELFEIQVHKCKEMFMSTVDVSLFPLIGTNRLSNSARKDKSSAKRTDNQLEIKPVYIQT